MTATHEAPATPLTEKVVKAACPQDCPDTCAMLVTVDGSGRRPRSSATRTTRTPTAASA
nr:hypothetical protein [Pseudonocardia sp. AL041005-10]